MDTKIKCRDTECTSAPKSLPKLQHYSTLCDYRTRLPPVMWTFLTWPLTIFSIHESMHHMLHEPHKRRLKQKQASDTRDPGRDKKTLPLHGFIRLYPHFKNMNKIEAKSVSNLTRTTPWALDSSADITMLHTLYTLYAFSNTYDQQPKTSNTK